MNPLLQIRDLKTYFDTPRGVIRSVDGVTLDVGRGEVVGIVGESGSGKSTLGLSILQLVPPPGRIAGGHVFFDGEDLLALGPEDLQRYRGRLASMVMQDPMTSLNPVLSIGYQVAEPLRDHLHVARQALDERTIGLLDMVGIPSAHLRLADYPHQFSGGQRQRIVTAMALAGHPKLLIADEPTTALDVTVQAQILSLFRELQRSHDFSILLVTHDMGVVAQLAQRVAIMYAGRIVESGPVDRMFAAPAHPYTIGLLASVPRLGQRRARLASINGQPPDLAKLPAGCRFAPRCGKAMPICAKEYPPEFVINGNHVAACWLHAPPASPAQEPDAPLAHQAAG